MSFSWPVTICIRWGGNAGALYEKTEAIEVGAIKAGAVKAGDIKAGAIKAVAVKAGAVKGSKAGST